MLIYHYTTIDTLALILKNKTIRFNRLDKVDDAEEIEIEYYPQNTYKFTYISCWTESSIENIALWKMYTPNGRGIRIGIEHERLFDHAVEGTSFGGDAEFCKFSYTQPNDNIQKIEYIDDLESIKIDIDKDMKCLALYKNKMWKFQEESRFILITHDFTFNLCNSREEYQKDEIYTPFHFDRKLSENAFVNSIITLGPLCNDSDRIIVEALCDKYCINTKITDSLLKGKINKRNYP